MPEFLSLTYTLPYHLIHQMEELAHDTNRSQSEVIAEAIRLYLRTVEARREHTRISTVEGFSYQQVAVAETYLEHDDSDASAPVGEPTEGAAAGDEDEEREEDWDEEEDWADGEDWDEENWDDEDDWDDEEDWEGADEKAAAHDREPATARPEPSASAGETAGRDPEPSGGAPGGTAPSDAENNDAGTEPAVETTGPAASSAGASPEPAPSPSKPSAASADADGRPVDAVADDATETEPRAEKRTVAVAADTREENELDQLVDPAAEVRRRLRKISGEKLGSQSMRSALGDIMREVDVKDYSPEDHSEKVAELALQLGKAHGLSGELLLQLEIAALVHDLGKASVPSDILEKRRPSPEEMAVIRQYPEFGADLLEIVPSMEPLKRLVAAHQERWNGSGYPDGLQGRDIPIGAQIIALCDVYNVLTTERRYRPAYSEDRARQIIRQNIGTLWNQEIARTFLREVIGEDDD